MKKLNLYLMVLICISLCYQKANAQAFSTLHTGAAGQWLGWDNGTGFDFDIKHEANQAINLYTSARVTHSFASLMSCAMRIPSVPLLFFTLA